ncbi:MAG TPA: RNB domain-containing ribonuclease [Casimicrobiaceae bacterium]|nr:RNB domain-containing ribonuclease [Casimicrobiaceae bacterium]
MHVLFEDEGQLRAGTVLSDNDASLQVEAVSGKRYKVKAGNVLLRFPSPSPSETLASAAKLAGELDATFLWEVSGDADFGFDELAREYYGSAASPPQQVAVALLLHGAPMHFYKRGRGRYRRAPTDALKAALASVERKKREASQVEDWVEQLKGNALPDAIRAKLPMLLHRPDKTAIEWKAVSLASEARRISVVALLAACGAIPSTHDFHFDRFLVDAFPRGTSFDDTGPLPALPDLPVADLRAFSVDDHTTTEIDDAFSVQALANGNYDIGIHIAAPALAIPPGSALDAVARERLSTVYMPGRKLTMLPEPVIDAFTLRAGSAPPALSLHVEITPDGVPVAHQTRLQRVPVEANLRLDEIGDGFADESAPADRSWIGEFRMLWKLVQHLSRERGKNNVNRIDFSFYVDWDADSPIGEKGRVDIVPRPRGSPLDKLVAELMIHVNNSWGHALAEGRLAGLYRTQSMGKVRMSTKPGEHQGLNLTHYLWASSPLRRYSDLVNQRQLLALLAGERAPYAENDAKLFAALADFEATYGQYAEFQHRMEHYWCLRWLLQENVGETTGTVVRESLVRLDSLPLVLRLADLPSLPAGAQVLVAIGAIDLLNATLEARFAGRPVVDDR